MPQRNLEWIIKWFEAMTDRKTFLVAYNPSTQVVIGSARSDGFLYHDTLGASGGLIRLLYGNRSTKPLLVTRQNIRLDENLGTRRKSRKESACGDLQNETRLRFSRFIADYGNILHACIFRKIPNST